MGSGDEILREILLGGTLSHKLAGSGASYQFLEFDRRSPIDVLESPGRDGALRTFHGAIEGASPAFPKKSELLRDERARGRLLHFFANHELLAIETMAYVLLRFPDAPEAFKKGVFGILQEEQRHLRSYLGRMEECGVPFGAVPLNHYFWSHLRDIRSPFDFVARMSLTFEQANLDFALEYAALFESGIGDPKTAGILRAVHDDEVRHVGHGWKWFQHWRDPGFESDFEAYRAALPFPLSARRARGARLFAAESRREAGLSAEFIQEVKVAGGSRGRFPDFLWFNPQCEIEASLPTLPASLREKIVDLEPLMIFLSREEDVLELSRRPSALFSGRIHEVRGALPEIITGPEELRRYPAFGEFKPWGFSPGAWKRLDAIAPKLRNPPTFSRSLPAEKLHSKAYWKEFLGTPGVVLRTREDLARASDALPGAEEVLVKSSVGTSGRGHLHLERAMLEDPATIQKLEKRLLRGDALVLEPFYQKKCDFSVQYEWTAVGKLIRFEPRVFVTDDLHQYQGAFLGDPARAGSLHAAAKVIREQEGEWGPVHERVSSHLFELGYRGPFGIDSMVARNQDGMLFVVPVIEVNVRHTMGRVAHEIEKACVRNRGMRQGIWVFFGPKDLAAFHARNFAELDQRFLERFGRNYLATTPAETAGSAWTAVFMNEAVPEIARQLPGFSAT